MSGAFTAFSNLTTIISVNAGATTQVNGCIYYRGADGERMNLVAIGDTIVAPTALPGILTITVLMKNDTIAKVAAI